MHFPGFNCADKSFLLFKGNQKIPVRLVFEKFAFQILIVLGIRRELRAYKIGNAYFFDFCTKKKCNPYEALVSMNTNSPALPGNNAAISRDSWRASWSLGA